ncbi:hypothetical protein CRYPA_427 [uncultured Candidatus Thioglobus sp.]|nr:hypothetical protein CRYPA_427 [uncultured Candidatus Thioglobus sp.]
MFKNILLLSLIFSFSEIALADVRITVSKGNASLCEVIPAKSKRGRHYNKAVNPREISSDLWRSGKNGLGFFKLVKSEIESQTIQLAFVDKYSTFWYYTKNGSDVKGIYSYDFVVPERKGSERLFVDIELEKQIPCSCFSRFNKPRKCFQHTRYRDFYEEPMIHYRGGVYTIGEFVENFGVPSW